MGKSLAGIGSALLGAGIFVVAMVLFWGTSAGIVKEHCADIDESVAKGALSVDSHWTYVIWPPLLFANADPPGRCVRNAPLHEALNELGILNDLGTPESQVQDHIVDQLSAQPE